MASLGKLAGPIGATLSAALIVKQVVDNRNRIIYNSKAIGYRVAKTWENTGLMHRKQESFSTFEKREVERFKQGSRSKVSTQTQTHSQPYRQKVNSKPCTKSHASQKVNNIPKGKSRKITVKAGDTPSGLAKKYGVSEEDVMKGAGITDPKKLIAGKTITVTNGGGSISKTEQSKSTVTNTDKSQSSRKNGWSQPPPPPEPPKKPDKDPDDENDKDSSSKKHKIHEGRQGKHIKGHNNYENAVKNGKNPGIFKGTIEEAQKLTDEFAGKGEHVSESPNKERVNFKKVIGKFFDINKKQYVDTTWGIIHYSKDGVHIVPSDPVASYVGK